MGRADSRFVRRLKQLQTDNPWSGAGNCVQKGFIGYEALRFLETKLEPGATIVELGSGLSTHLLVEMGYKVYTVEDKEEYLNKVKGATYIHAPLKGYQNEELGKKLVWYDARILRSELPADYDALLIDGPDHDRMGRYGACYYRDMFLSDRPILIDDLQQPFVYMTALKLLFNTSADNLDIHLSSGPKVWGWIDKKEME